MDNVQTVEQIRAALGQYLTKPVVVTTGSLSTQQDVSVSSISSGGLTGLVQLGKRGTILISDGVTNRILIGYQAGGF